MKKLAIIMSAAMVLTTAFSYGKVNNVNEKKVPDSLRAPIFEKLDPEITRLARENGVKVTGEQGKQFNVNGKSYLKPETSTEVLPNKDMTGAGKKGIAILVDFPVSDEGKAVGKETEVPGVNYVRVPKQKFNDLLNGTEYNPYDLDVFKNLAIYKGITAPTDRTLKNYYNEVSYNNFGIDVQVVDWVTLPHPYNYYMEQGKYYNENGDAHIGELVYDAIKAADKDVNFADYAVDMDPNELWYYEEDGKPYTLEDGKPVEKIVPNIFIIHRGTGAEYSRDPSIIWSHKWDIMSAKYFGYFDQYGTYMNEKDLKYTTVDGVAVNTYNIVPEVGRDISGYLANVYPPEVIGADYKGSKPSPAYVGTYAHEFGHVLGLPDQYDYGYDSEGTGMYTLMASGSYGRNIPSAFYSGNTPVDIDAWSKMYLGFAKPEVISSANGKKQSLTLRPSSVAPDIFKIDVPGSNGREYFLLENRQQIGFDKGLSYTVDGANVHGLAVYHIVNDILVRNFNRPNEAANWDNNHTGIASAFRTASTGEHHYGISLIQADGKYDMEKYVNDGDSGDLFPGTKKVTSLSSKFNAPINTTSLYKWNTSNTETGIEIQNIKENVDGTVTCNVVFTK